MLWTAWWPITASVMVGWTDAGTDVPKRKAAYPWPYLLWTSVQHRGCLWVARFRFVEHVGVVRPMVHDHRVSRTQVRGMRGEEPGERFPLLRIDAQEQMPDPMHHAVEAFASEARAGAAQVATSTGAARRPAWT
ncbi:hypothetical protein [Streptomyces sp. NPDC052042]|uniref:hypothetical protein n=1 Tax=Streptomyces sp. NPDC052042 TaxID=3365683 RepID=UPI0037D26095